MILQKVRENEMGSFRRNVYRAPPWPSQLGCATASSRASDRPPAESNGAESDDTPHAVLPWQTPRGCLRSNLPIRSHLHCASCISPLPLGGAELDGAERSETPPAVFPWQTRCRIRQRIEVRGICILSKKALSSQTITPRILPLSEYEVQLFKPAAQKGV
jgi:hypothetical protein